MADRIRTANAHGEPTTELPSGKESSVGFHTIQEVIFAGPKFSQNK